MELVDANIILRYLLNDQPEQTSTAGDILENHQVKIPFEVVAEVVYVLSGVYRISREEISRGILLLLTLQNISTDNPKVLEKALELYARTGVDFVDALLCARHTVNGNTVHTFDRKLQNLMKSENP